jgi:hypothetical protein
MSVNKTDRDNNVLISLSHPMIPFSFVAEVSRSRQRRNSFTLGRVSQYNENPVIGGIWGITARGGQASTFAVRVLQLGGASGATRKVRRLLCVFGSDSVASRLLGPKERAAFQIVLKRRAHMLLIASVSVQNTRKSHRRRLCYDQARSKRSRFITLFHTATKSCRNFSWESSHP